MLLQIPFTSLNKDIKHDFLNNKIKGIGIDYQYNGIYGYIDGKEVELYSFNSFFRADNRWNTYEIYCFDTGIQIEFIDTKVV